RKYIFSVVSLAAAYYFKFTAGPYLIVPLFVIFWGKRKSKWIKTAVLYLFIFMLLVSPWMVRSYMVTGNPVYPFFSDKIGCCSSDAFGSGHCEGRLFHQGIIARHVIGYFGMPSEYIKVDTLMPLYLSPESVSNMSQVDVPFLLPLFYLWYFAILVFCVPVVFGAVKLYKAKPKLFYVTGLVLIVSEFVVWLTILRDRCVTPRYTVPFFLFFALLWSMGCNEIFLRYLKTKLVKRIAMMFVIGVLVFNVIFSAASITYVSHKFSKDFAFYDFVKSNYERGTYFYDVSSDTFIYYTQMFNMKDIAKGVDGNLVFVKQGSAESGVWHFGNGLPSGLESFLVMEREFEHYKFYRINPDRESELLLFLEEQKE
ncbi:MAG: hypothetical protein QF915_02670, partial [Candidatus Woesearchaeota archaeon]|nr:hypothetical protein [Candidatus Woesearchaeota archaeon]